VPEREKVAPPLDSTCFDMETFEGWVLFPTSSEGRGGFFALNKIEGNKIEAPEVTLVDDPGEKDRKCLSEKTEFDLRSG
jgi:hypothetical protein